jgi:hypothetical protein
MPRSLTTLFCLVVALAVAIPSCLAEDAPAPQPTKAQAVTDAQALKALYDKFAEAFRGVEGGVSVHETSLAGMLKRCEEQLPKLQSLEQTALPEIEPVLARIIQVWTKPGAEDEARAQEGFDPAEFAFQQSGDIEWSMKMAAANNDVRAARDLPEEFDGISTRFSNLARMLHNVQKTRRANGEYLANYVKDQPVITFFVQDKRVAIMTEWKTALQWALKFDQTNEYANARLAKIDADIAALQKAVEREIDEKQWVASVGDFPGPGSVAELAHAAAAFFRKDPVWGNQGDNPAKNDGTVKPGVEIVAVSIRGPWQVAETDVFGRVISWRLPLHLAVTKPDLKAKNIARVYELSLVTVQGAPGRVAKAPPFDGAWVGNSWMMRLSKIPRTP